MFASTGATRLLPLLAAALAAAAMVWRHHGALVDEAFVALRAGLNLVAGHGLVLHPGDPAVVVAVPYSILAALAASLGVGGLPALRLASLLGLLLLLGAAAGIARTVGRELVLPVLLLLLPSYALAYWAIVPADPVWVATLIAGGAALFLLEIDGWRGSVLPFLLAAIISPATGIAYLVWRPLAGHGQPPGAALRDVAIFAVGFGAFLGWRWLAAGTPLLGEGDGGGAIAAGLLDLNRWIAAYPFVAGMLAWPVLRLRVRGAAPASLRDIYLLALALAVTTVAGGSRDLPYHAGFLPLLPLLTVLLASVPALMRLPAQVVIFLAAAHAVWGVVAADEERAAAVTGMVTAGREVGNWAAIRLNESEALATDTAGAVAYASARRTLSLRPGYYLPPPASDLPPPANRAEAVLQARPEIVVFRDPLHSHRPLTAADRELFDHPLFRFFYAPRRERLAEGSTVHYFALDRRDLELWPVAWQGDEDRVSDLVAAAVERWQKEPPPAPADSPEGVALHRQLEEAHAAAERGERDRVIDILEAVHQRNQTARVAGIPAAIGGIAARIEHLPLAIQGFKDQARLDPTSRVRHTHLRMFLRIKPEDLKQQ